MDAAALAPLLRPGDGGSDRDDASSRCSRRSSNRRPPCTSSLTLARSVGKLFAGRRNDWGRRKNGASASSSTTSCRSGGSASCLEMHDVNSDRPPTPSPSPTCVAGFDAYARGFFNTDDEDEIDAHTLTSFFSAATTTTEDANQNHYLPPELYGNISTYLLPNQEVGNLLLAVSALADSSPTDRRNIATIIRTTYLRRNYAFLAHSWTKPYSKRQANVREWMAVNDDWKDLYRDEEARRSGIFNLVFGNLMRATEVGLVDICRHLIEHRGADVNQEEVEPLLGLGRGENSRRIATVRPIMVAFKLPDANVLRYYLDEVRDDLDLNYFINERCGLRFVHQIVSLRHAGSAEHLRLLLQNGRLCGEGRMPLLDVNARVDNGMTCLHLFLGRKIMPSDAAQRLKILLEAGADPSCRDVDGHTPLALFKKRRGDRLGRTTRREIKMLLNV
jgi:hypothetical protein